MNKDTSVTDKELKEYAIRNLRKIDDELFWRIIWTFSLYDPDSIMEHIKGEQVEEVKSICKKDLLYELKVSKLEKGRRK